MKRIIFATLIIVAAAAAKPNFEPQLSHQDSAKIELGQSALKRIVGYLEGYHRKHNRYPDTISCDSIFVSSGSIGVPLQMARFAEFDYDPGSQSRPCRVVVIYRGTPLSQEWNSKSGLSKIWQSTFTKFS